MPASGRSERLWVSEWVIGIVGTVAVLLGLFILFGADARSIGIGDASWIVGEIHAAWGVSLVVAGVVAGAVLAWLVNRERRLGMTRTTPRTSRLDLYVHAGVFLLVNAFLWVHDLVIGDGLNYALWVTVPWLVVLALHGAAEYSIERGQAIPH